MKDKKDFDAVEMMRKLRRAADKLLEGKNYEEQRRYLDEHVSFRRKTEEEKGKQESTV